MVLDTPEKTVYWKNIKATQPIDEQPSGHIAIEIFEFPKDDWKKSLWEYTCTSL